MKKTMLFLATGVMLLACQPAATDLTQADKDTITSTATECLKLLNEKHDIPAYVACYYAEDATVLQPGSGPVKGRAEIEKVLNTFGEIELTFTTNDIQGKGDLAYVYGFYNLNIKAAGIKDNGKYIEIWRKKDGKWQNVYDIFNSSVPMPTGVGE